MKFDKVLKGASNLDFDESPFIYLTANPKYLDVLCVNCYECVPLTAVDIHSEYCKNQIRNNSDKDVLNYEDSMIILEKDINYINEKIEKLASALRMRLVEIEVEDPEIPISS